MQARLNSESVDVDIALRHSDDGPTKQEHLYVNDMRVLRVTHSRADDVPVVLVLENEQVVEVDPQAFYAIERMNHNWQPGEQSGAMGIT